MSLSKMRVLQSRTTSVLSSLACGKQCTRKSKISEHLTLADMTPIQYSRLLLVSIYTYDPEGSCLPSWCHNSHSISI